MIKFFIYFITRRIIYEFLYKIGILYKKNVKSDIVTNPENDEFDTKADLTCKYIDFIYETKVDVK